MHIKQNKKKNNKEASYSYFSKMEMAFILNTHRTTLYKTKNCWVYKLDKFKEGICNIFHESKGIYGRRKIQTIIAQMGILMNLHTLSRCLMCWNLITNEDKKENLNLKTNVSYMDLAKRNYNPNEDNIVATDVLYIHANVEGNHVYLSIVISYKTKLIESWKISKDNNTKLILDTLKKLKKVDFILHSDHALNIPRIQFKNNLKA